MARKGLKRFHPRFSSTHSYPFISSKWPKRFQIYHILHGTKKFKHNPSIVQSFQNEKSLVQLEVKSIHPITFKSTQGS